MLPQTSQSNTSASKRVGLLNPGGKSGWPRKSTEDVMLITSQAADLGALTRPGLPARLHAASWLRADRARAPMITQRPCALTSSPRACARRARLSRAGPSRGAPFPCASAACDLAENLSDQKRFQRTLTTHSRG